MTGVQTCALPISICTEGYRTEAATEAEKLQFLADTFNSEYGFPDNIRRYGTKQNCFAEWLQGLPSCFNVAFYYADIIALAKLWGSIPENATEAQEDKICNNWWRYLADQTFQLFRKYNVTV